uniref:Chromosome 14 putative open reading frame 177 n=1 Tax=Gorilla gorilla gorilla TaxID=9595 RepID=G3R8C9_GORGO
MHQKEPGARLEATRGAARPHKQGTKPMITRPSVGHLGEGKRPSSQHLQSLRHNKQHARCCGISHTLPCLLKFHYIPTWKSECQRNEETSPGSCNHQIMSASTISAFCATPRFKQLFKGTAEQMSQM